MLTTLFLFGALASVISLASVVLASPFSNGEARISAALRQNTIDPDTPHRTASATLKPRYDYEPGDQLKRTMCFCTSDNSLEQVDNDPFVFKNVSVEHQMGMYYKFEYYNHRFILPSSFSSSPSSPLPPLPLILSIPSQPQITIH